MTVLASLLLYFLSIFYTFVLQKHKKMNIDQLNETLKGKTPQELINFFVENYAGAVALSSSLSIEDQVLTDMVVNADPKTEKCRIFTLDTGRLFPETYSLIEKTNMCYGIKIEVMFPQSDAVEQMVKEEGVNLFYKGIESRKRCCGVRKMEPLRRAFSGLKVWICGLRKEQSITRADMKAIEWDEGNQLIKVNPLIDWTEAETWEYIKSKGVPYNVLHERGFLSIGCQPCTRAVEEGEDIRAGRWWWENPEQKECGLHKH